MPRPITKCGCSSHIDHSAMCDDECDCFGGTLRVERGTFKGRRAADVLTRIWLEPDSAFGGPGPDSGKGLDHG